MTAALLFLASFAVVFLLCVQQLNVTAGYRAAAIVTSVGICIASLWQFKILPGPTTALEIVCYIAGAALGVYLGMIAHPVLERILAAPPDVAATLADALQLEQRDRSQLLDPDDGRHFEAAGLAKTIADEGAVSDIESFCVAHRLGRIRWYDTRAVNDEGDGGFASQAVARAARYLDLRDALIRHPTQPALVRFKS